MDRNLDGIYFRIDRGNGWEYVCFSDLTAEQQENVMTGRDEEWLKSLARTLANTIREIGYKFDIVGD